MIRYIEAAYILFTTKSGGDGIESFMYKNKERKMKGKLL